METTRSKLRKDPRRDHREARYERSPSINVSEQVSEKANTTLSARVGNKLATSGVWKPQKVSAKAPIKASSPKR